MTSADGPIPCAVEEIDGGIEDDCELSISCNNQRFQVLLSRNQLPDSSVTGSLLRKLDTAVESRDDLEMDAIHEEIGDIVCEACQPIFRQLAPVTDRGTQQVDLQTYMNPQITYLQLVIDAGKAKVVKRDDGAKSLSPPHYGSEITDQTLPRFFPPEIQVLEEFRRNAILKVRVGGEDRCCKLAVIQTRSAVEREFACLKAASDSGLPLSARVPRLVGLVQSDSDTIIGILEEYIEPSSEAPTLEHFDIGGIAMIRRKKWADQIQKTVKMLHGVGVVWGDGKAGNVIVDTSDDAWVIDFGGSWTDGWVDEGLAGTVQGDEQALGKIDKFLDV
ncbi:hypothetical protein CC80DRAFT_495090 [Byssothecium circinans]|uniref:Protein kinase domain-containing protein n=1 Tax=Byssothecium circinans TaxID=147558 RepID=A0A6A5TM23_9PLEO|nr:hypothetical protein CC80DRAFT_495090 [Byssothecium circinans]